jgi:hypothetical protein
MAAPCTSSLHPPLLLDQLLVIQADIDQIAQALDKVGF